MKKLAFLISALLIILISFGQAMADDSKIEKAKELFERLVLLSHEFNADVADLYSNAAIIKDIRHYPFGESRKMTMSGKEYKAMIRKIMPLAKLRGDISTFSDVTYSSEGDNVRVKATRYSQLKNYSSPYSLLIGMDDKGDLTILEELTESRS